MDKWWGDPETNRVEDYVGPTTDLKDVMKQSVLEVSAVSNEKSLQKVGHKVSVYRSISGNETGTIHDLTARKSEKKCNTTSGLEEGSEKNNDVAVESNKIGVLGRNCQEQNTKSAGWILSSIQLVLSATVRPLYQGTIEPLILAFKLLLLHESQDNKKIQRTSVLKKKVDFVVQV